MTALVSSTGYARVIMYINLYQNLHDYELIDTPIEVSKRAIEITKPAVATHCQLSLSSNDVALVASAEQAFLQLRLDGQLNDGKYVSMGMCFRDEPEDELHQKMFFKGELIHLRDTEFSEVECLDMVAEAKAMFGRMGIKTVIEKTSEPGSVNGRSYDLNCKHTGIELGSYGVRYHEDIGYWMYGTAIAEPRLGIVLEKLKELREGPYAE